MDRLDQQVSSLTKDVASLGVDVRKILHILQNGAPQMAFRQSQPRGLSCQPRGSSQSLNLNDQSHCSIIGRNLIDSVSSNSEIITPRSLQTGETSLLSNPQNKLLSESDRDSYGDLHLTGSLDTIETCETPLELEFPGRLPPPQNNIETLLRWNSEQNMSQEDNNESCSLLGLDPEVFHPPNLQSHNGTGVPTTSTHQADNPSANNETVVEMEPPPVKPGLLSTDL